MSFSYKKYRWRIGKTLEHIYDKLMIDFAKLSKRSFLRLAREGRLNPHHNDFTQIGMVIEGTKPVTLLQESLADYAANCPANRSYLAYESIPKLSHCKPEFATCGLYRKGDGAAFEALCEAYDFYPYDIVKNRGIILDKNTVRFDIALGRALGYADTDIARFLEHNYGYRKTIEGLHEPHGSSIRF